MTMTQNTEFTIPLNLITKIIAETVTDDISVQEDFIKALSRATSLFILYSTTKANEIAGENNRRTIHSQDVINAIDGLGFRHLVPELISWHSTFVDEKEKENAQKTKKKKANDECVDDKQPEATSD